MTPNTREGIEENRKEYGLLFGAVLNYDQTLMESIWDWHHQQLQKAREERKGWKGYVAVDPKADNYKYSPVFSDRKGAELWVKGKEINGLEVVEVDILLVDHSELDQDKKYKIN